MAPPRIVSLPSANGSPGFWDVALSFYAADGVAPLPLRELCGGGATLFGELRHSRPLWSGSLSCSADGDDARLYR